MLKTRLFGFAIACSMAIVGISPTAAFAAATDTDTQTVTQSEKDNNHKGGNRALYEERVNNAIQKWDTLTANQKNEVYALLEEDMKVQNKVMDKLVQLGVMDKTDSAKIQSGRTERFEKLKKSGEFPLMRHKGKKKCK